MTISSDSVWNCHSCLQQWWSNAVQVYESLELFSRVERVCAVLWCSR